MALFLTESHVEELLTMADAVAAVENVCQAQGAGQAWLNPRQRLRMPQGMLHTMSAAWPERGYFAHKAYASVAGDIRFRVFLYDAKTGIMAAVIEGNRLGQLRTGAATAVAAKFMLSPQASTWALIGTGLQAWGQIEALLEVAKPQTLRVVGRDAEKAKRFCGNVETIFGLGAQAASSANAAVEGADVVITATTAKDPVFSGKCLQKGAFVAAVGANMLIKRELDGAALKTIDRIVVDDIDTAKLESGLLQTPIEAGFMHWQDIGDLPGLVCGRLPSRQDADETLCFHSLGSATWDLAVAIAVYEQAKTRAVGTEIALS